jgi:glutaredoxin-like protein
MIPLKDQEAIRVKFARELMAPVKIDYFTQKELGIIVPGHEPCATCKPTGDMLRELAALSDLISLRVHMLADEREEAAKYGVERVPGIVLRGRDGGALKLYGMPGGMEFPSFLDTIGDVSRMEILLSEESVKALRKVKEDVRVKVFIAPTCPYCPGMARAAFQMTLINPHVKAEVIQIDDFPDIGKRYEVQAVPFTLIAERIAIQGAAHERAMVEQVVKAVQSPAAQPSGVGGPSSAWAPKEPPMEGERRGGSGLVVP